MKALCQCREIDTEMKRDQIAEKGIGNAWFRRWSSLSAGCSKWKDLKYPIRYLTFKKARKLLKGAVTNECRRDLAFEDVGVGAVLLKGLQRLYLSEAIVISLRKTLKGDRHGSERSGDRLSWGLSDSAGVLALPFDSWTSEAFSKALPSKQPPTSPFIFLILQFLFSIYNKNMDLNSSLWHWLLVHQSRTKAQLSRGKTQLQIEDKLVVLSNRVKII